MGEFPFYLKQGINHITDIQGFDHMLFIVSLCAVYKIGQWKNVLVLVTAFTIGHSITLALTAFDLIKVNRELVELLIPITILLTCVFNIIKPDKSKSVVSYNYFLALFFGLIHGMGFSNFFKTMMMGISDSILMPLLAFNIGIEIGQLVIILIYAVILFLFTVIFRVKHRDWVLFVSGLGFGLAAELILKGLA